MAWQRCTVHFLRDLSGHVHKDQHDALGAVIRSIFTAPDGTEARRRLADAVNQLELRLPKVAGCSTTLRTTCWRSTLPQGALAKDPFHQPAGAVQPRDRPSHRRRRDLPRRRLSVIRLVSMLAIEANDEWLVGRAYISQKSMALLDATTVPDKLADHQDQQEVAELIAA